jgi:hypothetical protein
MRASIRNLSAVTTVGLDIAKNVFQVRGVDAAGAVVVANRSAPLATVGLLRFVANRVQWGSRRAVRRTIGCSLNAWAIG